MSGGRILVAGIGNVFKGDDAFGCEVVRELRKCPQCEEVKVVDFGIRSYDLAFALTEDYEALIMIDAAARGVAPGIVSLIEPDLEALGESDNLSVNAHDLDPVKVLQMAHGWGRLPRLVYLVSCEPAILESDNGEMGLSTTVRAAVPRAIELVESLIEQLLPSPSCGKLERASFSNAEHEEVTGRLVPLP